MRHLFFNYFPMFFLIFLLLTLGTPGYSSTQWEKFKEEYESYVDRVRLNLLTTDPHNPDLKNKLKLSKLESRLLKTNFPDMQFWGDTKISFAVNDNGQIFCLAQIPSEIHFASAPDLKSRLFSDFLLDKEIKVTTEEEAVDVAKMIDLAIFADPAKTELIENSDKYFADKVSTGWIVFRPNLIEGRSVLFNYDYEIFNDAQGRFLEYKRKAMTDSFSHLGLPLDLQHEPETSTDK